MSEENEAVAKAYKRAAIGLAVAALLWTATFLIRGGLEDERANWLIPIAAAGLSVFCFSRYSKSK